MAASIVSFFLQKLSEQVAGEVNFLSGVPEKINLLRRELEWICFSLNDADARRKEDGRAQVWVNQVRDVVYDAEDVIDEFFLKLESQRRITVGVVGYFRSCLGSTKQWKTLHDVGTQIDIIKTRAQQISENASRYGIKPIQSEKPTQPGESSSSLNNDLPWQMKAPVDIVGFEDDTMTLVKLLTEGETRLVISISGMGGLGKTTLAQKVYNSIDVGRHFEYRVWTDLSQEYRFRENLVGIIKQITGLKEEDEKKLEKMDNVELRKVLLKYLEEKRYLVVLDGIGSIETWDILELIFPEGAKGSRILLTTRNKDVVIYTKSIPHELRYLTKEECWELFCKKAFPTEELTKIGEDIVEKCQGLPLAVVVVGGLLSRKEKNQSQWETVLKSFNWTLGIEKEISKILSLSYNDLDHYLKLCFLYFGVFPRHSEIPVRKLFQLWVAEGLVKQRDYATMEEVAGEYLQEFIIRSMVQVSKRRSNGDIKTCRIHDLILGLSLSEAKGYVFLDVHCSEEFEFQAKVRRLTIHGSLERYMLLNYPKYLRSLLCFGPQIDGEEIGKEHWSILCKDFRFLRVLELPGVTIVKLPSEIGKLIHLRYLGLRGSLLTRVPSTISNLVSLQTLDIQHPSSSGLSNQIIPNDISKMNQLRHLYMTRGRISGRFRIDCLRNLQTLSGIEAGDWIKDGLDKLTKLRKLRVQRVLNSHKEALSNSIMKLNGLKSLHLEVAENVTMPTLMLSNHSQLYKLQLFGCLEKLPEPSEFPPKLTYFSLTQSSLMHDPIATLAVLPHLKILKLQECTFNRKIINCDVEGFPQLEELNLKGFSVVEWKIEKGMMSSLRHLKITGCNGLNMLLEGLQHVTTLQELELDDLSVELKARILKERRWDRYNVRNVLSVIIDGNKIVSGSI